MNGMDKGWSKAVKKRLGRNLCRLRTAQKLTMYDVAKQTGLSWHTIQKWEYGYNAPGTDILLWLCRKMDWRLGDVLRGCNIREEAVSDARTE